MALLDLQALKGCGHDHYDYDRCDVSGLSLLIC